MSKNNLLLLAGLVMVGYWFYTRKPKRKGSKIIDVNPKLDMKSSEKLESVEPKTIKLDLSTRGVGGRPMFPERMVKDFDTSKEATIAPPQIRFEMIQSKQRRK
jgi:hypothetical protein